MINVVLDLAMCLFLIHCDRTLQMNIVSALYSIFTKIGFCFVSSRKERISFGFTSSGTMDFLETTPPLMILEKKRIHKAAVGILKVHRE